MERSFRVKRNVTYGRAYSSLFNFLIKHKSKNTNEEFHDEGEKLNLIGGDVIVTEIWMEYIQAHSDKDLDKIAAMDAEDIIIHTSDGTVIKGSAAHKLALAAWFESSNPMWKVNWMATNTIQQKDGEKRN